MRMHSGRCRTRLAYRCGGSAGLEALARIVTGFPFQSRGLPTRDHLKPAQCTRTRRSVGGGFAAAVVVEQPQATRGGAFVGIDDQMRARLMGLLTQLDLDVVLTSHEFWGFYDTVPALVLYDLTRRPPLPGVHAQRFDWTAGVESAQG